MTLNPQLYISKARSALLYFHNESFGRGNYKLTFDQLLNLISKNKPDIMMTNLGRAIYNSELSDSEIRDIFIGVAKEGNGRIPSTSNEFFYALQNNVKGISWQDVKDIAVDSAAEIGSGIISASTTVLDTVKTLGTFLPLIVIAVAGFYVFKKSRSVMS